MRHHDVVLQGESSVRVQLSAAEAFQRTMATNAQAALLRMGRASAELWLHRKATAGIPLSELRYARVSCRLCAREVFACLAMTRRKTDN